MMKQLLIIINLFLVSGVFSQSIINSKMDTSVLIFNARLAIISNYSLKHMFTEKEYMCLISSENKFQVSYGGF